MELWKLPRKLSKKCTGEDGNAIEMMKIVLEQTEKALEMK